MDPNVPKNTVVDQTIWLSGIVEHVMQIVNHPGLYTDRLVVQDFARRTGKLASEIAEKLRRERENTEGLGDDVVAKVARKQENMNKIIRGLLDGLTMDNNRSTSFIRIRRSRVNTGSFEPALRDAEERLRETADAILATIHEPSQTRVGVYILSLCGDGVRVLSQLLILRDIIERVGQLENHVPLPCKYFDLIVGTGTGAIAAIFLRRLEMTVQEAISAFCNIFWAASTTVSDTSSVDLDKFAEHMKTIVQEHLGDPFALMNNPSGCKTLVFAARKANLEAPQEPFRSFRNPNASVSAFKIVDVAAAACAPPDRPVRLGSPQTSYTNAALFGHNNPTQLAIDEAEHLWDFSDIKLVLCINTGARAVVDVGGGKWKLNAAGRALASGSGDPIHDRIVGNSKVHFMYDSPQVNQGLEAIVTDDWSLDKTIGKIVGVTQGYLRFKQTEHATSAFAKTLFNGYRIQENLCESTSRANNLHSHPTNPFAVQPQPMPENVESPLDTVADLADLPYAEGVGFESTKECLPAGTRGAVLKGMDTISETSTKRDAVAPIYLDAVRMLFFFELCVVRGWL